MIREIDRNAERYIHPVHPEVITVGVTRDDEGKRTMNSNESE